MIYICSTFAPAAVVADLSPLLVDGVESGVSGTACVKQDGDGIKITLSQEREPLGTAGPIALAKDLLNDGDPFFVMNCDIACEFNLRALLDFHHAHGKERWTNNCGFRAR